MSLRPWVVPVAIAVVAHAALAAVPISRATSVQSPSPPLALQWMSLPAAAASPSSTRSTQPEQPPSESPQNATEAATDGEPATDEVATANPTTPPPQLEREHRQSAKTDKASEARAAGAQEASDDEPIMDTSDESPEPSRPALLAPSSITDVVTLPGGLRPAPEDAGDAGDAGDAALSAAALAAYGERLKALMERHKRYPSRARKQRREGTATVALVIAPSGGLLRTPALQRSSGVAALDREALRMAKRAAPYPKTGAASAIEVHVPVRFSLMGQ